MPPRPPFQAGTPAQTLCAYHICSPPALALCAFLVCSLLPRSESRLGWLCVKWKCLAIRNILQVGVPDSVLRQF